MRAAVLRIPADDVTTGSALQSDVLNFALKVFSAAHDVLEALLNVYESVAGHSTIDDWDLRLSGLERVAKATILGHLLPVLITSLTHVNLRSLHIADSLMHQLVRLVILASQVALHLKQKSQNISKQQQQVDVSSQKSTPLETTVSYDPKEGDLLDGLKIPAPWARGSTVESIHPVRDNYKFKETVHIPGARCLFLRFDPRCSSQYDYDKVR